MAPRFLLRFRLLSLRVRRAFRQVGHLQQAEIGDVALSESPHARRFGAGTSTDSAFSVNLTANGPPSG